MASSARNHHLVIILLLMLTCLITSCYGQDPESTLLFKFRSSLENTTSSLGNWNSSVQICNGNFSHWKGLICFNGKFIGLQLESMGLSGTLDIDTLSKLTSLRTISVMNNNFEGPFPDVKKIGGLRGVYLSNNRFSGELPDDAFAGMKSIRRIFMANNEFTGKIPTSLLGIPKLVELQLQDNKFDGSIPAFVQQDFQINVANNRLEGPIPSQLSSQSANSFAGNLDLCGKPMPACPPSKKKKGISIMAIILAAIGGLIIGAIIIFTLFLLHRQRKKPSQYEKSSVKNLNNKATYHNNYPKKEPDEKYTRSEKGKLYFVRRDREKFDLEDLLRAPAEVLGSGSFGSSYKADLPIGKPIVVRRFRQMSNMGKEDFHEHMRRLGKLSHPNVLPLVAFYYRREEKLLVTDFVENGSLASHLHANYLKQGKGANADLAVWVNSVVREEWTGEVFDKDMNTNTNKYNCEGEMLKLLKIGMCCCEMDVGRRWDLREALEKIEELKESDDSSNYASEGEMYSSKAISDDDFCFSNKG
ncbi:hypothetical protein RND71_016230 [Anisodus tanguticus]|uniref:Protein kinase domain-containing protein n=1 Tax=Anisodus tanguticus TaxID=243964 RepID=A0AAE1S863_9SOLA|nr:hypothetical protein RND71_016230 [Anisodus tanguticus]